MTVVAEIHSDKTPKRRHFIPEWAEARGLKPVDLIRELDADKSTVYRWYDGKMPRDYWFPPLASLLHTEPESLFRHPDDDWLARFFAKRNEEERARARQILEAAFPPERTGTDG